MKFAFFDVGVAGTYKILKVLFGVSPLILKKVGVLPTAAMRRGRGKSAKRLQPETLRGSRQNSTFFKIWVKSLKKMKNGGVPVPLSHKNANLSAEKRY